MPDYKRLVSYMYNYENGLKRNNVGYARVEARNGQCKCTLHIAAPSLNDRQLKAYIFKRREKGLEGVLLGTMQIRNGYGDYRIITDSEHIMNSPYGLDDMGGIIIFFTDKKFFGTEWDNMAITLSDITTLEHYPENKKESPEKDIVEAAAVHSDNEQDNPDLENEMEAANFIIKKIEEEDSAEEEKEDQKSMEESQTQEDSDKAEDLNFDDNKENNDVTLNEEETNKNDDEKDNDEKENEEQIELEDNPSENEDKYNNESKESVEKEDLDEDSEENQELEDEEEQEEDNTADSESSDEDVTGQECRANEPKPFFEDHPTAMRIYRSFPRMYPFEDNEVAWCVRIEPQDIGLFPMEDWILANNSFLLHGYYSYRHLIFARINDTNGFSYVLGVPGIYHNREKFMAKMFGFENFKCVKRKERKTGEFGYWYIPIMLS